MNAYSLLLTFELTMCLIMNLISKNNYSREKREYVFIILQE